MIDTGGAVIVGKVRVLHEPASAGVVRHQLAAELTDHGITPESVEEVVLVASELVGNAIRHTSAAADGMLEITWQVETNDVLVCVADASSTRPHRRDPADDEPGGRGLTIVDSLAEEWGVDTPSDHGGSGKEVWARVPVRRARAFS